MGNLNKVLLIGNLGKDPEVRYTTSGNAVASFSIATNEFWTDKQGQKQKRTEWHNVIAWDRLADLANNYLKRGSSIFVEGKLQTSSWDDPQSGQKRYKTEIVARTIEFLDRNDERVGSPNERPMQAPAGEQPNERSSFQQGGMPPDQSYTEDDIPF